MEQSTGDAQPIGARPLAPLPLQRPLLLFGLLFLAHQLVGDMVQATHANCDKTFVPSASLAGQQTFVPPNSVRAKAYTVFKDQQGNWAARKNVSRLQQAAGANAADRSEPRAGPAGRGHAEVLHCLYRFVAHEGERVALNFSTFQLRGEEPECNYEYVDVYLNAPATQVNETTRTATLLREPPSGRFCSTQVPHKLISLHNVLVLAVYSALGPPADGRSLFAGTYEFLPANKASEQTGIGPPDEGTLCTHTIRSTSKREGDFQSITYPGIYPKGLRCSYKLVGEPNQRIRLEFLDLDLYSGGSHCPLDSMKIFDGLKETDPLIQTICGSHRSLIIYSTRHHLLVTFTTLERELEVLDRGFSAYFEFSDKFYAPTFIQGRDMRHIRGTECDQRIVSSKGSRGLIVSPEPKRDHPNAVCRYFFEALLTTHDIERVVLKFTDFDLKPASLGGHSSNVLASTTTTSSTLSSVQPSDTSNSVAGANGTTQDQCPDNYVRIYTSEQKPDQKQDPNDYDYVFCGNEVPGAIESDAASMLVEFNSGSMGGNFRAEYTFIDDYRIPGLQSAGGGCNYIYRSDINRAGTFNSPHYPALYMNNMSCTYSLYTRNDEALLLQFTRATLEKFDNTSIVGMGQNCTGRDVITISEVTFDPTAGTSTHADEPRLLDEHPIGLYCGTTTPGPFFSNRQVLVQLRTNKENAEYGFNAIYQFYSLSELNTNEFVNNCGGQIHASQRQPSGTFASPSTYRPETYEKRNHICSWNITARASYRIGLDFTKFELEGVPAQRGCASASVRIELGGSRLPKEFCGPLPAANPNATNYQFVSDGQWMKVTFISTKQASGSGGFEASWAEIS